MSAPGFAGHSDEEMLAQLSTLVGIPQGIGTQEDAERVNVDRCVWIDDTWEARPIRFQPSDGEGIAEHARSYKVALYAAERSQLVALYHALYRGLDALLSRTGFEMSKASPELRSGVGGTGWSIRVPVTIKGPIYRRVLVPIQPTTTTIGITVTDPAGENGTVLS